MRRNHLLSTVMAVTAACGRAPGPVVVVSPTRDTLFADYPSSQRIDSSRAIVLSMPLLDVDAFSSRLESATVRLSALTSKEDHIDERYRTGFDIIAHMDGALNTVTLIHEALLVEQGFSATTNIWADQELRHGWDEIQRWATALGTGATATFLLSGGTTDTKLKAAGIGLSIVGAAQLIGRIVGPESRRRLKDKVNFIDFTRAAFDDIRVRSDLSFSYKVRNDTLIARFARFNTEVYAQATTTKAKASAVGQLLWYVNTFDAALEQLPEVFALYRSMIDRYSTRPVQDPVRAKLTELGNNVARMQARYEDKVRGFLALTPEIRAVLLGLYP